MEEHKMVFSFKHTVSFAVLFACCQVCIEIVNRKWSLHHEFCGHISVLQIGKLDNMQ